MLNKLERYAIVKYLRLCSIIGPLPIHIDLESWQLNEPSNKKQIACVISYYGFVLHTMYKIGTLAYVFFFVPQVQLHQLMLHAVLSTASAGLVFWYYEAYLHDPALFAMYAKITLAGNDGGPTNLNGEVKRRWISRLREYSMQDLIATSLPYMITLSLIFISASYIYDPSMRLLLYAALPSHLQTWATFGLCLLEELRFMMVMIIIAVPIWQLQVMSFDLVCNQLQLRIRKIHNGTESSRRVYSIFRRLQLYVSMLNSVNSYLIFTWKLMSITMCIVSGFAAVAHFSEHPVFGVMYYVILFDVAFSYTIIYEKAFKIPELFDQAAACALLRIRGCRYDVFRRQVASIPCTGIKVGSFHKMERVSTPIFMNYVVTNIASMLVAYG